MTWLRENKYLAISASLHVGVLLILILGFDFTTPMPVIENTNKNDIISAVILGDSVKSKIIPHDQPATPPPPPPPVIAKETPKPLPPKVKEVPEPVKKDVIALDKPDKKKVAEQKQLEKKRHDDLLKDLLADMKPVKTPPKTDPLKKKFDKLLKQQAQQSLRENFTDDIKLQTTQSRQAQGQVDKYKALILQVVSEHWIIPPQVRKNLYSTLMIRLAPGGMVLDVQVVKPSGDPSLDSSARAAVLKSSPLPVPSDPQAFQAFKQFTLKVRPDTIL